MDARISYHADGSEKARKIGCLPGQVFAQILDVSRKDRVTYSDDFGTYTLGVYPVLFTGTPQNSPGAARMQAREWAEANGVALSGDHVHRGNSGAEADIAANYPGGLAAFRRAEQAVSREPRFPGDLEGYA